MEDIFKTILASLPQPEMEKKLKMCGFNDSQIKDIIKKIYSKEEK